MKARKSVPKLATNQKKKWLTLLQSYAENEAAAGYSKKTTKYRVVADTNVLISGIMYGGASERVLEHIITNQTLIISSYIIDEFIDYLKSASPKISHRWIRGVKTGLQLYSRTNGKITSGAVRDIKDEPIISLAISQRASIVTGDKDILEHRNGAIPPVLSVSEYEELFID